MKNKKFTIGLVLLIAGSMAFTSCTKGKTNPAPEQDKEIQSSSDRAMAEWIASDLGEIAAQGLDGNSNLYFYANTVTPVTPQVAGSYVTLNFSNTTGWDGRTRSGTFIFNTAPSTLGASYYRQVGFTATCTVSNYVVDGYTVNVSNFQVQNTTAQGWVKGQDLSWKNTMAFSITRQDGKQFTYDGYENKVLKGYLTTGTFAVISNTANPILWQNVTDVEFSGQASGTTFEGDAYTSTVDKTTPLVRNYLGCAPEKVLPASLSTRNERHPFVSGIMTFKLPNTKKNPRTIDFGQGTCDYNVNVTIDGITYQEDVNW